MKTFKFLKIQIDDWEYFREGQEKINFVLKTDNETMLCIYKELIESKGEFSKFMENNNMLYKMNKNIFDNMSMGQSLVVEKEFFKTSRSSVNKLISQFMNSRPSTRVKEFQTFPLQTSTTSNSHICCFITRNLNSIIPNTELEWAIELKPKGGVLFEDDNKQVCGYCNKVLKHSRYCSNLFYSKDSDIRTNSILSLFDENSKRLRIIKQPENFDIEHTSKQISEEFSRSTILETILFLQNFSRVINRSKNTLFRSKEVAQTQSIEYGKFVDILEKLLDIDGLLDSIRINTSKCNILKRAKYKRTQEPPKTEFEKFVADIEKIYNDISFIVLKGKCGDVRIYLLDIELKPLYKHAKHC